MMATKQYAMVVNLHACVGCAACDIACKRENNVPVGFAWSNHMIETRGVFPDVSLRYIPTLCNHCSNAPCVANCPTTAMHKTKDGLTISDPNKCIGCRTCQLACPYGAIFFNNDEAHRDVREDNAPMIPGCTATGQEIIEKAGTPLPVYNPAQARTTPGLRPKGVVEKCTFCDHRLANGESPACVEACPTGARIFGDRNDPKTPPHRALAKYDARVRKPEKGTKPNVFYIREY